MKGFLMGAMVAAALAAPLAALGDDEGDIKYRQSVMKSQAGHAGAIAQIVKGKVSHDDQLMAHAQALLAVTAMIPDAFKNETMGEAKAKPEVWSDRADFEAKADDLHKAAMALADAAKSGPDAAKGALGPLFDACKACHKKYKSD